MSSRKPFLVGLNLIAPGVGQLVAGMWFRGALELLAAIACLLWALLELITPIVISVRGLLSDSGDEVMMPNLWRVGASLLLLILLYAWSIVELSLLYKEPADAASAPGATH